MRFHRKRNSVREARNTDREAMLARLYELRREHTGTHAARRVDDFILYAEVGRDREKLGMEWAQKAEAAVAEAEEFEKRLAGLRGDE